MIDIKVMNNSVVNFNYSFIAKDKCNLELNSNLEGNDNKTEIKVSAVTEQLGSAYVKSTAKTKEKIINNNLIESIKILLLNDEAYIHILVVY